MISKSRSRAKLAAIAFVAVVEAFVSASTANTVVDQQRQTPSVSNKASAAGSDDFAIDPRFSALSKINAFRHQAGLDPVTIDPQMSVACTEHTKYMALNLGTPAMVGLNAHKQNPSLPGASSSGAECGAMADLAWGDVNLNDSLDLWMASLYHRRPILDPGLKRVAVGFSPIASGGMTVALMFIPGVSDDAQWPVYYPGNEQTNVPLSLSAETPYPVPDNLPGGYPITLQFPPFEGITNVTAAVEDENGNDVPLYISDPEHPATFFGQYGVICLIPKSKLSPLTTYHVEVHATWTTKLGKVQEIARSWSFTTGLGNTE